MSTWENIWNITPQKIGRTELETVSSYKYRENKQYMLFLIIKWKLLSVKQTVSNRELYPLPSIRALCGYRRDVAGPSLPINYLHSDIPVVATVTCAERHSHSHGEVDAGSVLNFDPDHSADQLLRAGHHQAAQGVGHLTSQDFSHTCRCSDEACVWYVWGAVVLSTSEPRNNLQETFLHGYKAHDVQMKFWSTNWNLRTEEQL